MLELSDISEHSLMFQSIKLIIILAVVTVAVLVFTKETPLFQFQGAPQEKPSAVELTIDKPSALIIKAPKPPIDDSPANGSIEKESEEEPEVYLSRLAISLQSEDSK